MKLLLLAVGVLLVNHVHGEKEVRAIDDFGRSLREFTGYMYHMIATSPESNENIFFSPLSVSQALGMVMAGSKGNTFRGIETALMVNLTMNYTEYNYRNLFKKIYNKVFNMSRGNPSAQTLLANRMYVQENYPIKDTYKEDLEAFFDVDVVSTSFDDPTAAADLINGWVANKTQNLITDLMEPDSIESTTRLVLVNTVFFKASWKYETLGKGNKERIFHAPGRLPGYRVPFIKQKGRMRYYYDDQHNLMQVAIPYQGNEAYLVMIMPRTNVDKHAMNAFTSPGRLMSYLTRLPENFRKWTRDTVTVFWPKFSIDKTMDMKEVLTSMGANDLFSQADANLSGITEQESLYVSTFRHRAKVVVNEEGTIAAAASGISILARSAYKNEITIDRPFLFAIYRQGYLLFFGRVNDPMPEK